MAKEKLTDFLNREIKKKGSSVKEEKAKASKYSSISAAKKAGSLYYTNKKGVVMAAVYAEDLKDLAGGGYGSMTAAEKREVDAANKAIRLEIQARKDTGPNAARKKPMASKKPKKRSGIDPINLAGPGGRGTGLNLKMPRMGVRKNKGGMMKKKTGYAAGGMPMVMKNGKKVPAYAADGVGKMNVGGMAKKKPAAKMMAGGMTKKKPAAKMMAGGMSKKSGYMYGGMAKKKPAAKKK